MSRFLLEVYCQNDLIFYMEFRSITSVAKAIDRFMNVDKLDIWFDLTDLVKDKSISVKELMAIWHS